MADEDVVETILPTNANEENITTQGTTQSADVQLVEETVFLPTKPVEKTPTKAAAEPLVSDEQRQSCPFNHLTAPEFSDLLSIPSLNVPQGALATVRITLFSRGVPQPCARIYRIPSATPPSTAPLHIDDIMTDAPSIASMFPIRQKWLDLVPSTKPPAKQVRPPKSNQLPKNASVPERVRALAQELLQNPPLPLMKEDKGRDHPELPGKEDLIGFVTTGNFNLAQGSGTGVGSLGVERFIEGMGKERKWKGSREERLCVVRNSGEEVGRLGYWVIE